MEPKCIWSSSSVVFKLYSQELLSLEEAPRESFKKRGLWSYGSLLLLHVTQHCFICFIHFMVHFLKEDLTGLKNNSTNESSETTVLVQNLPFTDEKETSLLSNLFYTSWNSAFVWLFFPFIKSHQLYSHLGGALYSNPQGVAQVMIQSFQLSSCAVFKAQLQDVSPMCLWEDGFSCFICFSFSSHVPFHCSLCLLKSGRLLDDNVSNDNNSNNLKQTLWYSILQRVFTFDSHCHHPNTGMECIHFTDKEIRAQKTKWST